MIYEITVPASIRALKSLHSLLEKAQAHATAHKFESDVFLGIRLFPDQFPFSRQVQIACDTAKLGAARLTGQEAPSHADTEKTLPELMARIESTLSYLSKFKPADYAGAEVRKITHPRWDGKHLTGFDFATMHVLPNLYFHVTTAYAILRHNGVSIGKKDYLGELPFKM